MWFFFSSVTQPLKKALRMMGAPNLISDNMDCGLSYSVISYLKKLSQQVSSANPAQSGPVQSSPVGVVESRGVSSSQDHFY